MGRIGKRIIAIPKGVTITVDKTTIKVKGPKGELLCDYNSQIKIVIEGDKVRTECASTDSKTMALQGLYNSLLFNMIIGVTLGFEKRLDLVGVGYRAIKQGKNLQLQMGFSHPVEIVPPVGIEILVEGTSKVIVKGMDKQVVGAVAADIRAVRKVEPYKGKGIRYEGEIVRKKAGKAAKAAGGGA